MLLTLLNTTEVKCCKGDECECKEEKLLYQDLTKHYTSCYKKVFCPLDCGTQLQLDLDADAIEAHYDVCS